MLAFRPEEYAVHTAVYDGPLELLLYLIRRDGIDVRDIPIAHVTEEYLQYLDRMRVLDLDLAGDFLVMAATLCQLKSRELLPRDPALEEEEEEDPRERLARRLQEYERYKEASEKLTARHVLGRDVFKRPTRPVDPSDRVVDPTVDVFGLLEAFYNAVQAHAAEEPVHAVELETYSFAERVTWILDAVADFGGASLTMLFESIPTRDQRILTFLAVLEMARLQLVDVRQLDHLGDIRIELQGRREDCDLSALAETWA
ncbi:MAG: segregation/condensation protein A [Proteobacteria bacterium]|nr:segregation/condensation protein A [Pseudomonadota bacterium]MCP4919311.1 segregation/condensation protein A [Pseudomonadota bacterium]